MESRPTKPHQSLLKPIPVGGTLGGISSRFWGYRSNSRPKWGVSMALTDTEIRRSKPGDGPYKLSDGHGLYLLVKPNGGRLWRWKYRVEGKEKLMALGTYPELSLADARERHAKARRELANGIDPMAERMAEKTAVVVATEHTFEKIAELWLEHWRGNKCTRHSETTGIDSRTMSTRSWATGRLRKSSRWSLSSLPRTLKPVEPRIWRSGFFRLSAWCSAMPSLTATASATLPPRFAHLTS